LNLGARPPGAISLTEAAATVHGDPRWWRLCLGYGAAAATLLGLPLAAGLIIESFDNSKRGYPTPLPPWSDPSTRYLAGIFALLIDFTFFVLPCMFAGLLAFCGGLALTLAGGGPAVLRSALAGGAVLLGLLLLAFFMLSVAPLGRLRFADEGRIEQALSSATLRQALHPLTRPIFLRARMASLPAYLPALSLCGLIVALAQRNFPGQGLVFAALIWLSLAALVYAHLIVVQLYIAAEHAAQRRTLGM
jgi:hypothetical protein